MDLNQQHVQEDQLYKFMLIAGIIIVSFNLRPAITSVGPLITTIRDDIGLTNWSAGLLTSLPLLAFAFMSPIAAKLGNRFSNERTMLWGLMILTIGISLRSISMIFLLVVGTILVGIGIAVCNVLLPGVIKEKFPLKVGLMTSVYSTGMGTFAALASGLSVPLASGFKLGWNLALFVWVIPTLLGIVIWFYLARKENGNKNVDSLNFADNSHSLWSNALAWQIAFYMGLQSFLFYVTISWLPEILHATGVSMEAAGWMLSLMQFIGLPASFFVPVLAGKYSSQRLLVVLLGISSICGYLGLLLGNSHMAMFISIVFLGIGLGGTFPLALTLLGLRSRNARQAANLSGMAQSLGYLLAAIGPMLFGFLFDITHAWTLPLITLIFITVLVITFGLGAGRNKFV
ncbi:CynX/NimT family MFS transporter [Ornithinibacillus bavariensis]|uniref:Transporter YycB n=1 Tax=Ornithinibacillus bavariensis TaxID=545502 RepID=A0A919X9C2_9BACI|nr:MFS transporter [Ornithinibacillus bavariensis]GIO26463.1 putative transporter YycB [Ornithinibacillus bavariensis]